MASVNGDDLDRLVSLGLTRYESAAYLALTSRGQATGAEVARLAGVPRQRIYDVLEALGSRGLATVTPGRPARYVAAPPEALGRLLDRLRARTPAALTAGERSDLLLDDETHVSDELAELDGPALLRVERSFGRSPL